MKRTIATTSVCCLLMLASICQASNLELKNSTLITNLLESKIFKVEEKTIDGLPVEISSKLPKDKAERLINKIIGENAEFRQIDRYKYLSKDKFLLSFRQFDNSYEGTLSVKYIGYTGKYELASKDKAQYYPRINGITIGDTDLIVFEEYLRKRRLPHFSYDVTNFRGADERVISVLDDSLGFPGETKSKYTFSKVTGRLVGLEIEGKCRQEKVNALQDALKETYATQTDCSFLCSYAVCKRYYTFPLTAAEIREEALTSKDYGPRVVLSQKNKDDEYRIVFINDAGRMVDDKEVDDIIERLSKKRRENIDEIKSLFK